MEPNGDISSHHEAKMYEMLSTAVVEKESETKVQKWSLEHKKNMVSQFGTSKSKRKLNQMMNNIIEWLNDLASFILSMIDTSVLVYLGVGVGDITPEVCSVTVLTHTHSLF